MRWLLIFMPLVLMAEGKFVNPITDICWECVFPITISGINVTPSHKDQAKKTNVRFCKCPGLPPKIGVPLTFWEPTKLIDITRHAYKLIGLGGISVGQETIKNRGTVGIHQTGTQHSFHHIHIYSYPVFEILKIFTDFDCIEKEGMGVSYMSELDLTWSNDEYTLLFHPEAALFTDKKAYAACVVDCISSSAKENSDKLFWCAGCQGSLYPFNGNLSHHISGTQASSLLLHRALAKLHRCGALSGYEDGEFCQAKPMSIIKKSLYKIQPVIPVSKTCHPLGKSDILWRKATPFPFKDDGFVYLLWVKKHYCMDTAKAAWSLQ